MKKQNSFIVTSMIFTLILLAGCKTYEIVYCPPDNTPVRVLKKPEKAYPIYAKQFDSNLKATVNVLQKVTVGVDSLGIKNKVVELRDKLNNDKAIMQDILKTNYMAYSDRPCNDEIAKRFFDIQDSIAAKSASLEQFRIELEKALVKGKDPFKSKDEQVGDVVGDFKSKYSFSQSN